MVGFMDAYLYYKSMGLSLHLVNYNYKPYLPFKRNIYTHAFGTLISIMSIEYNKSMHKKI